MKHNLILKPLTYLTVLCVCFISNHSLKGQSFYISNSQQELYLVDIGTCDATLVTNIDYLGENMNDIAFHPDGTLYGITGTGDLISINLTTGVGTFVLNIPQSGGQIFTSLIASDDGIIYASDKVGRLIEIDVAVPSFTNLGIIMPGNGAAGDLSFNGGDLYMASEDNTLVQVNINNPGSSTTVATFPPTADDVFGVVSVFTSCTQITTYAMTNTGVLEINDISTGMTSPSCDLSTQINGNIYGGAAVDESKASECKLECDLNGSAAGQNQSRTYSCSSGSSSILDATIAEIISTSDLTNITVTLSGIQNAGDETLTFIGSAPSGITVAPSSGVSLTLSSGSGSPVNSFLTALSQIEFSNGNASPTTGLRTISLDITNLDGENDNMCSVSMDVNCASSVNIDLDELNTVETGNNHSGIYDCVNNEFFISPNPKFEPDVIDTFILEIVSGIQDIGDEVISIPAGNFKKEIQNGGTRILMINEGGVTPLEFTQALRNAKYVNNANPKTRGVRRIEVTGILGQMKANPIAVARIEIEGPNAGRYDSLKVCETGDPISLFDANRPAFPPDNKNGTWTLGVGGPALASGTDIFEPGVDQGGIYVYTMLDACPVQDTAQLRVIVVDPANIDPIPDRDSFCVGSTVDINAVTSGASNYSWSSSPTGSPEIASGAIFKVGTAGTYYLTVELNGCEIKDQIVVSETAVSELEIQIDPDTNVYVLCEDQSVTLTAAIINPPPNPSRATFEWNTREVSPIISVDEKGVYKVEVKLGCDEGSDSIRVRLEDCSCPIYVPNAFNPLSSSGANGSFYPITDSCSTLIEGTLSIFSRWGDKLFVSNSPNKPWTGGDAPLDTYAWHYKFKYRSPIDNSVEIEEELRGFVILVK